MPKIVLNAENTKENKREKFPSPQRAYISVGRTDNKHANMYMSCQVVISPMDKKRSRVRVLESDRMLF